MKYIQALSFFILCWAQVAIAQTVYDETRNRAIPITVSYPGNPKLCSTEQQCPVAFLSAGYGVSHTEYSFLSEKLSLLGYLVIAIGHELPNDPPLSVSGNLYETRAENWQRGAITLDFLQGTLKPRFKHYNFDQLLLIGHSNGGDISAWSGNEGKSFIQTIITLDHRRVALPRNKNIQVLSIRASDFPADAGVLPTEEEQRLHNSCVVTIPDARHNDIADFGPTWLKAKINTLVTDFLRGQPCSTLRESEQATNL